MTEKLSQRLADLRFGGRMSTYALSANHELIKQAQALEADSELLNALIEMISPPSCYFMMIEMPDNSFNFQEFTDYGTLWEVRESTPRAVLEAGVAKWREAK